MVAFPHVGSGPYGTSGRSPRASTSDAPKLDAAEIENIFQNMNHSQEKATPAPSRPSWFSRQYSNTVKTLSGSRRGSKSESESK